jgi:hypothetical protein
MCFFGGSSIRHGFILKFLFSLQMCQKELRNLEEAVKIPHYIYIYIYIFISCLDSRGKPRSPHFCQDSSGRVISPTLRPLLDNTQHSQETDNYATGGIPTRNPSKRSAADPRLRPRGHWDRHGKKIVNGNSSNIDVGLNTPTTTSSVTTKRSNNYHNSHLFCNIFFGYTTNVNTFFHLTHWGWGNLICLNARSRVFFINFNPLNAKLNSIWYLLASLAHHILHVSRIRVKSLTLSLLMLYIHIYIYIWNACS